VPVAGVEELRTRTRLRTAVAELGPVTAGALADRLGLTSAAVRRHLDAMTAEGTVETREPNPAQRRGRGRPAREYVVSSAGHEGLPAGYDDLALSALAYLAEVQGPAAVQEFAERRLAGLEERLGVAVAAAGTGTEARVAALAAALTGQGYAASARPVGRGTATEGTQLCQGHCPVRRAAEAFPELCEAEAKVFERVLGTRVQRLATLARGDHVCTTHVPTDDSPAAAHAAARAGGTTSTTSTSTTLADTTAGTATPTEGRRR
jgi:predicted ArsR family transcriptional regulator